jgi:hypothetical protein
VLDVVRCVTTRKYVEVPPPPPHRPTLSLPQEHALCDDVSLLQRHVDGTVTSAGA